MVDVTPIFADTARRIATTRVDAKYGSLPMQEKELRVAAELEVIFEAMMTDAITQLTLRA